MDADNQYDPGLMAHSSPGRLVGAVITIKGQELQGGLGPGQTRHSSSHHPSQPGWHSSHIITCDLISLRSDQCGAISARELSHLTAGIRGEMKSE